MRILWDEIKRRANLDKHGMDFATLDLGFFIQATILPGHSGHLRAIGWHDGRLMTAVVFRPLGSEALSVITCDRQTPRKESSPMAKLLTDFVPGRGYAKEDWDAVSDNPEWTEADFNNARPMKKALPELYATIEEEIRKRGPAKTKEAISIRLDIDLVEKLRASGPGWQSRVNEALREWVEKSAA